MGRCAEILVKQADNNAIRDALIGAGLGGLSGGGLGYLLGNNRSALLGALTGAGVGGAAGYGLSGRAPATEEDPDKGDLNYTGLGLTAGGAATVGLNPRKSKGKGAKGSKSTNRGRPANEDVVRVNATPIRKNAPPTRGEVSGPAPRRQLPGPSPRHEITVRPSMTPVRSTRQAPTPRARGRGLARLVGTGMTAAGLYDLATRGIRLEGE